MDQGNNLEVNEYAGGLIVTIYRHNTKQVKKRITGIKSLKRAVHVATV
tara:strand:- start:1495 stop:1638 length:144 start_codon:yes stop_codon:yes gene_type:complete